MKRALLIIIYWCSAFLSIDVLLLTAVNNEGKELELSLHASFVNVFLLLTASSFLRLITIRPGFLPKPTISVDFSDLSKNLSTKSSWVVCKSCSIFTSPTARHCTTCNGCLVRSRGHWSAMCTCVGVLNHKFLIQLLFWGVVFSTYTLCVGLKLTTNCASVICCGLSLSSLLILAYFLYKEVMFVTRAEEGVHVTLLRIFGRGNKLFWLFPCSSSVSSKPNIADM
ncbi:uncharacterized protein LOC134825455 [Bolinopsis microptera]|uniref:uncharacterized protein LOC134825455 n=1 Tax=Bolinopsis microptera TaxID=2820187 RepID=UPI003078F640